MNLHKKQNGRLNRNFGSNSVQTVLFILEPNISKTNLVQHFQGGLYIVSFDFLISIKSKLLDRSVSMLKLLIMFKLAFQTYFSKLNK